MSCKAPNFHFRKWCNAGFAFSPPDSSSVLKTGNVLSWSYTTGVPIMEEIGH